MFADRMQFPWTKYHFAFLISHGVGQVFDTMRYEAAFPVRKEDAEALKQAAQGLKNFHQPLRILLCKNGEGRGPCWTHARLLSDQRFELITNVTDLYEANSPITETRPRGLRWKIEQLVTGTAAEIIDIMVRNRAFPENEGDAHRLEQAPFTPGETLRIKLKKFGFNERDWEN